jgi:hypothetical protein
MIRTTARENSTILISLSLTRIPVIVLTSRLIGVPNRLKVKIIHVPRAIFMTPTQLEHAVSQVLVRSLLVVFGELFEALEIAPGEVMASAGGFPVYA